MRKHAIQRQGPTTSTKRQPSQLKQPEQQHRMIDSVRGLFTNFSYSFNGLFSKPLERPTTQEHPVYSVCGSRFSSSREAEQAHQALLWFTYRKHIRISASLSSDINWGCMLRVAQMVLAEALRKFHQTQNISIDQTYLIASFLQSENGAKYSLGRLVEIGKTLFNKEPGMWYSVTQAAHLLQQVQSKRPLKGTEHLKIVVNHQNINMPDCRAILAPASMGNGFSKSKNTVGISLSKSYTPNNCLLLVICLQFGKQNVSKEEYELLLELVNLQWFSGCLGGKPKQARFLTGRYRKALSYLDPHHVDNQVQRINLEKQIHKFHCQEYRVMDREDLDPNIAVCYFLRSQKELEGLAERIQTLKERFGPMIGVEWEGKPQKEEVKEEESEWENQLRFSNCSMDSSFLMD